MPFSGQSEYLVDCIFKGFLYRSCLDCFLVCLISNKKIQCESLNQVAVLYFFFYRVFSR